MMKEVVIGLNWLDIILLGLSLLSGAWNIIQFLQRRHLKQELRTPIYNSIVGLFMDIKTKMRNATLKQQLIMNPQNPHSTIETIRWEYQSFAFDVANWMQGFQDELTGIISTLNPEDKKGEKIIKAQEFGLDDNEIEIRRLITERNLSQLRGHIQTTEPSVADNEGND